MINDFVGRVKRDEPRSEPVRAEKPHEHYYHVAMTKTTFEPIANAPQTYRMVEYAYMLCRGCQDLYKTEVRRDES